MITSKSKYHLFGVRPDRTAKFAATMVGRAKRRMQPVGSSWRADETYVRVKGKWCYLYRAVDKAGKTIDFYLSETRYEQAAYRFFMQAIRLHGGPQKITIDGSSASRAALEQINRERSKAKLRSIEIRQIRYLNSIVEQDHRAVKRITKPMLGFKSFASAAAILPGIELVHMIRKGQLKQRFSQGTCAQQFEAAIA